MLKVWFIWGSELEEAKNLVGKNKLQKLVI